jgi:DNA invertase Pin-like site-specific DNA recombinase
MMNYIREGDILYVESISRLARSTHDLLDIIDELQKKKVSFVSEKEYIRTGGNPLFSRVIRLFLCCFVAYLSLKSVKNYWVY